MKEGPTQTASWEAGMRSAELGEQMAPRWVQKKRLQVGAGISFNGACT